MRDGDEKTTSTIIPASPVERSFAARRAREKGRNQMIVDARPLMWMQRVGLSEMISAEKQKSAE